MRYLDILVKVALVVLLAGLVAVVSLQIFARFLLPKAPSWTEELSRVLLLFLVALGTGLTLRRGAFLSVELLHMIFPTPIAHLLFQALGHIATAATSLVLLVYSFTMVKLGAHQTSPAMALPMPFVFASMIILPFNLLLAQCYLLWRWCRARKKI